MLGVPPAGRAPHRTPGSVSRLSRRHRAWLLIVSALGVVAAAVLFGAPGVIVDLTVLVLGLLLLGAVLIRARGTSLRAVSLVFLLVALVATGMLKAAWLASNLPSKNDHSSPWPYLFVVAVAPLAVLIAAFAVRRSSLPLSKKFIRVAATGLLVGLLPWLFLMMTGIAD